MPNNDALEQKIEALLSDEQYQNHPLREVLVSLFQEYKNQQWKLGRLASISDDYQWVAREQKIALEERHQKQKRRLTKITRISDGYQEMLQERSDEFHKASLYDHLTNIPNRRLILGHIKTASAQARRNGDVFSLAIIDVDDFKAINDQYGHGIGDQVLIQIARTLTYSIRGQDICARWGGEEFMLLLPAAPGSQAVMVAERVRSEVEHLVFNDSSPSVKSSISIGVAEHLPNEDSGETITRADHALYEAKRSGRNKVVLAQ